MAVAAFAHGRLEGPGEEHRRLQVHAQRPLDLVGREALQFSGPRETGVGDQAVHLARIGGEPLGGSVLAQIGSCDTVLTWQRARELVQRVDLPSAQDQACAPSGKGLRDRSPDAACRSREQHRLAIEVHVGKLPRGARQIGCPR